MSKRELSQNDIDELAKKIGEMKHFEMCKVWRFTTSDDPRISNAYITSDGSKLGEIFSNRLFKHFGGFTPEISKSLGWG